MTQKTKILVLSGSGEARRIIDLLHQDQSVTVVASLSGATRQPKSLPVETRRGGFGGYDAQKAYILDEGYDLVIDATHPFAAKISERTSNICREISIPYLHVRRSGWVAEMGDHWTMLDRAEDAEKYVPVGSTVFLATGRSTLESFANLSGRKLICRQIDPPDGDFPFENGSYLVGNPPFSVMDEENLFARLGVDFLIVKNAGGMPSRTKLDAARKLGIEVLMLTRPPLPDGEFVKSVDEAVSWVKRHQELTIT